MPTTPCRRAAVIGFVSGTALLGMAGTASAVIPTDQSMGGTPDSVASGSEVTFDGTLTGMNDRPLSDESVALEHRSGDGGWQVAATGTTNQDGAISIPATVDTTSEWRYAYGGDRIHDPSRSATQTVETVKPMNQRIVDAAAAQAGKSYSYGASGPETFDCSGLTQHVHKQVGIDLPRTSSAQHGAVQKIADQDKMPGDLVFFHDGGSVYHVGVYAGDNQMWAAPESGDVVRKQDIWTSSYSVGRAW